jgi:Phosphotransferase enzyme family
MQHGLDGIRPHPRLGWLAAIVPVSARRFRVEEDPEYAAAISGAGGALVDDSPDVEIGAADDLVGDAPLAIVPIGMRSSWVPRRRSVRGARRLASTVSVGARIARARRAAHRRGYETAVPVAWEPYTRLVPGLRTPSGDIPLFQRFPRRAVVVCTRGDREETALEAAVKAASEYLDKELGPVAFVLGSSGVLIGAAADIVLRVSLGPAARRIEDQRAALASLREADPGALVAERVPWVLAAGTVGLARWSVERRLPGKLAAAGWREVTDDALEFLTGLFEVRVEGAGSTPARDADICASHFPEQAEAFRDLGFRIEEALAEVPRGFDHGDFWGGNLLLEQGRLTGVVDWPSAGPGRLPLLDLFQLRVQQVREETGALFSSLVSGYLLPELRAGGHELDRAYCRRLGLEFGPPELVSLGGAYWLEELRHALLDPDRDPGPPAQSEWRRGNEETLNLLGQESGGASR